MQGPRITDCPVPEDVQNPPVAAIFDRERASSDGGAVLLEAAERVYGLIGAFAGCLTDRRTPERIRHSLEDLLGQRIFGIACSHADGNDAAALADDPVHKLLLGRDPVSGPPLASQPTISRFENAGGSKTLYRLGRARLADRRRLRALPGDAVVRARHHLRPHPGGGIPGPAAEDRRRGGPHQPPRRPAHAVRDAAPAGVAAHRPPARSEHRIVAGPGADRRLPDGPTRTGPAAEPCPHAEKSAR